MIFTTVLNAKSFKKIEGKLHKAISWEECFHKGKRNFWKRTSIYWRPSSAEVEGETQRQYDGSSCPHIVKVIEIIWQESYFVSKHLQKWLMAYVKVFNFLIFCLKKLLMWGIFNKILTDELGKKRKLLVIKQPYSYSISLRKKGRKNIKENYLRQFKLTSSLKSLEINLV